jgi:hypothetical protein
MAGKSANFGYGLLSKVGHTHGMMKVPLTRYEWGKRTLVHLEALAAEGADINDPETLFAAEARAAKDAMDVKLQGENRLVDAMDQGIGRLARSPKAADQALAAFINLLVGIRRVGFNFARNAADMTGFGVARGAVLQGSARLRYEREAKGAKESGKPFTQEEAKQARMPTPEESRAILKAYGYGGLGLVAVLLAYFQPDWFQTGGFYQSGSKKKGRTIEPMGVRIAGHDLNPLLTHNPFFYAVQFWTTFFDQARESEPLQGAANAVMGLAGETPGQFANKELVEGMGGGKSGGVATGKFLAGQMGGLSKPAEWLDRPGGLFSWGETTKRIPQDFVDALKMPVPWARESVGEKPLPKGRTPRAGSLNGMGKGMGKFGAGMGRMPK